MRIAMFYHSLLSDWNHGNAHFLRGVLTELMSRGHRVRVYEPRRSWSLQNLIATEGKWPLRGFKKVYPALQSSFYETETIDLDRELGGADLVIVHEWNDQRLIKKICEHRTGSGYRLVFHDTHHRSLTAPEQIDSYRTVEFDGVLAYGRVLRDLYLRNGWAKKAWTWHEAADTRLFRPGGSRRPATVDLVWIGNWGDGERTSEIREFLIRPSKALGLKARAYGVRYPEEGVSDLADAGIEYGGWLPNYAVPRIFSGCRATIHIPRRPYTTTLPGIPTIRVFEALACGVPLVCAPWDDLEGLFTPGKDYLVARDGREMKKHLSAILHEPILAAELKKNGLATIRSRHTCAHRVNELMKICSELGIGGNEIQKRSSHAAL